MTKELYRYTFKPFVPLPDLEASLLLAIVSAESLHGATQVRLDASHFFDPTKRACVIDAGTDVGRDVNRLFVGLLLREFAANSFTVERINELPESPALRPSTRKE